MASYHLNTKIISRAKGQSSIASAAYRSASRLFDAQTGEVHDYTRKRGVLYSDILAPENTPDWMLDQEKLWNAVEAASKHKKLQLARDFDMSLPAELTHEQHKELVLEFVQKQWVSKGLIADVNIHAPGKRGDDRNHHVHVMLTMRELTGDGFGLQIRATLEERENWLKQEREQWAIFQNRALERYGHTARVDHRSYEDQGIDRQPTQHLGPTAHEMEQTGKPSRIGDENRAIANDNSKTAELHRQYVEISMNAANQNNPTAAAHEKTRLARQKEAFENQATEKQVALESFHIDEKIQLDRRHEGQRAHLNAELEAQNSEYSRQNAERIAQYSESIRTMQAECVAITNRLEQAKGLHKLARDVLGRTRADERERETLNENISHQNEAVENLNKNAENVQWREQERRDALENTIARAVEALEARQHTQTVEMQQRIGAEREQHVQEDWKTPYTPAPGNTERAGPDFEKAQYPPRAEFQLEAQGLIKHPEPPEPMKPDFDAVADRRDHAARDRRETSGAEGTRPAQNDREAVQEREGSAGEDKAPEKVAAPSQKQDNAPQTPAEAKPEIVATPEPDNKPEWTEINPPPSLTDDYEIVPLWEEYPAPDFDHNSVDTEPPWEEQTPDTDAFYSGPDIEPLWEDDPAPDLSDDTPGLDDTAENEPWWENDDPYSSEPDSGPDNEPEPGLDDDFSPGR